eukprot:6183832-Pleurochrysis_carterae.AAC.2
MTIRAHLQLRAGAEPKQVDSEGERRPRTCRCRSARRLVWFVAQAPEFSCHACQLGAPCVAWSRM